MTPTLPFAHCVPPLPTATPFTSTEVALMAPLLRGMWSPAVASCLPETPAGVWPKGNT